MGDVLLQAASSGPVYTAPISTLAKSVPTNIVLTESGDLWHQRLGHCGASVLDVLREHNLLQFKTVFSNNYVSCCLAKSHRLLCQSVEHRTNSPLELINLDVWQSPVLSHHSYKYYVSFIDDYSRFTWIYPMRRKSEVYELFTKFQLLVENLFNCKIKMFQSDGGREFDNSSMHNLFNAHGIYFCKSCPDTQQQNGVAKRKHPHILEMTRSFLIVSSMPNYFW